MTHGLSSTRLALAPAVLADEPALLQHWSRPEVRRFLFDDRSPSAEEVRSFLVESRASFAAHGLGLWRLLLRGDRSLAGCVRLQLPAADPSQADLLYSLEPACWGRGLATEASRVAIDAGFRAGLVRITASIDTANQRSLRVLERLGFTFERETAEGVAGLRYYALEPEDYSRASARS